MGNEDYDWVGTMIRDWFRDASNWSDETLQPPEEKIDLNIGHGDETVEKGLIGVETRSNIPDHTVDVTHKLKNERCRVFIQVAAEENFEALVKEVHNILRAKSYDPGGGWERLDFLRLENMSRDYQNFGYFEFEVELLALIIGDWS